MYLGNVSTGANWDASPRDVGFGGWEGIVPIILYIGFPPFGGVLIAILLLFRSPPR